MRKVIIFSALLVAGLVLSQLLPATLGDAYDAAYTPIRLLTMVALSFIMIHVGLEFDIDKNNVGQYGWDYVVAATAAAFPWIFVALYIIFVILPPDAFSNWFAWKETLLASRFAAPTSAGVLFSMLAAAGLGATWLFRKARVLAIFDDLDTVLLMIPLKMMMVGVRWQLAVVIVLIAIMLYIAWRWLHALKLPHTWRWVLLYAALIAGVCELIYLGSMLVDAQVPIHFEVLLPGFVLGCIIAHRPHSEQDHSAAAHGERRASTIVSALFMVLVGLSMPAVLTSAVNPAAVPAAEQVAALAPVGVTSDIGGAADQLTPRAPRPGEETPAARAYTYHYLSDHTPPMTWPTILLHVLAITVVSNFGKMFPALCYRREAPLRHRLALAIGMWPRGEVGAGVLVVSLSYGIGGPVVTIAMLSLAVNLVLTGVFIIAIKALLAEPAKA